MRKTIYLWTLFLTVTILYSCNPNGKDLTPPTINEENFMPADCDIYYPGDIMQVHFVCSDNVELGNFNIEIHNNFDHHTHGTSHVDCDGEEDEHHHEEGDLDHDHEHHEIEGAWVYNKDFAIARGLTSDTIDLQIPIPEDAAEGDYHFMLRLTDRAGWQSIKAVAIHLHEMGE